MARVAPQEVRERGEEAAPPVHLRRSDLHGVQLGLHPLLIGVPERDITGAVLRRVRRQEVHQVAVDHQLQALLGVIPRGQVIDERDKLAVGVAELRTRFDELTVLVSRVGATAEVQVGDDDQAMHGASRCAVGGLDVEGSGDDCPQNNPHVHSTANGFHSGSLHQPM